MVIRKPSNKEIEAYQLWEKSAAFSTGRTRYLNYVPSEPIFTARDQDVATPAHATFCSAFGDEGSAEGHQAQSSAQASNEGVLPELFDEEDVRSILDQVDGKRDIGEIIRQLSGSYEAQYIRDILNHLLGRTILLPATIGDLEQRISINEIVRIPLRSPYAIMREYWENQGTIRQHLSELGRGLATLESFKTYLADLHIIATMGSSGTNYYGGGGGIETTPGHFRSLSLETDVSDNMVEFISRELSNMGYSYPTRADKTLKSSRGSVLGFSLKAAKKHHHHYDGTEDFDSKLDEMRETLLLIQQCSATGDINNTLKGLAYFHWLFSHLHPFTNINNSIAMNIVNNQLATMKIGYIPHLFLDYFAQRTGSELYEKVFARHVEKFSVPKSHEAAAKKLTVIAHYYQRFKNTRTAHQLLGHQDGD